eukprot:scaffold9164_cov118-Skeletonema_dohrnii-CCMP3373.AAC.2
MIGKPRKELMLWVFCVVQSSLATVMECGAESIVYAVYTTIYIETEINACKLHVVNFPDAERRCPSAHFMSRWWGRRLSLLAPESKKRSIVMGLCLVSCVVNKSSPGSQVTK